MALFVFIFWVVVLVGGWLVACMHPWITFPLVILIWLMYRIWLLCRKGGPLSRWWHSDWWTDRTPKENLEVTKGRAKGLLGFLKAKWDRLCFVYWNPDEYGKK